MAKINYLALEMVWRDASSDMDVRIAAYRASWGSPDAIAFDARMCPDEERQDLSDAGIRATLQEHDKANEREMRRRADIQAEHPERIVYDVWYQRPGCEPYAVIADFDLAGAQKMVGELFCAANVWWGDVQSVTITQTDRITD